MDMQFFLVAEKELLAELPSLYKAIVALIAVYYDELVWHFRATAQTACARISTRVPVLFTRQLIYTRMCVISTADARYFNIPAIPDVCCLNNTTIAL